MTEDIYQDRTHDTLVKEWWGPDDVTSGLRILLIHNHQGGFWRIEVVPADEGRFTWTCDNEAAADFLYETLIDIILTGMWRL